MIINQYILRHDVNELIQNKFYVDDQIKYLQIFK